MPSSASDRLWDHQRKALAQLHDGQILVGGVGSGKSRTAIAYWLEKHSDRPLVVITTAMKRDSLEWQKDLAAFGKNPVDDEVLIDSWNKIKYYIGITDAFFIFDEQKLVGNGTWVKSFLKIAKSNKWILLSGTPGDVWMDYVPVFLANGFFKNRTQFTREHVVYSRFTKYPKIDRYIGERKLEILRRRVIVEMPVERRTNRHIHPVPVDYDHEMYDRGTKERFDFFKQEPMQDAGALCYYQRHVVNSSDARRVAMGALMDKHPRLVVFYSFDYELDILRDLARERNRVWWERNGHLHETIDNENHDDWLYLVQYASGSEAWNCTSTDAMVLYSQTYSWKVREQAMGRIDRMNTPYTDLYYYEFVSDSTIDQAIRTALGRKRTFNERSYESDLMMRS